MYTNAIWIKAIALIIVGLFVLAISVWQIKKPNDKKKIEFYFAIFLSLFVIVLGSVNATQAINPNYETVNASYISQTPSGEIFGRKYLFKDATGKCYDLSMDPITYKKIFSGKSFYKNKKYTITYETKSETIVGIKAY